MENLPIYVSILFLLTVVLTLIFLYLSAKSLDALRVLLWLGLTATISATGFYLDIVAMPPRLAFLIVPPVVFIALLFVLKSGRIWLDTLEARWLTWLHVVRVPVEVSLFLLFTHGLVPKLMTFEGSNFDIISGITAPLIAYLGYHKKVLNRWVVLGWNLICLGLLFNIVIHAVLSAPYSMQQFGFDQPNVALLHFPFIWLPGFVVPTVLFSHLVSIRQLVFGKRG